MTHPAPDLSKLSEQDLVEHLREARADKKSAELAVKKINNEILTRKNPELQALLNAKTEPYGTVNVIIAGTKVKFDFKKKVVWDQEKLAATAKQIKTDGGKVEDYIKTTYEVPESRYKAWGDNIKAFFIDARTVAVGSVTVTLDEEGDE